MACLNLKMDSENNVGGYIPLVPYESYEEYEVMLERLIEEYQEMVNEGVNVARLDSWCKFHEGLSWGVKGHWLQNRIFDII